jgi:glutaredoxin-like protein NrdH
VKEFLSREGVAFTVKNVDDDEQAYRELVARGFRSIPVTIVGEQAIRGYDEEALRAAIAPDREGGSP